MKSDDNTLFLTFDHTNAPLGPDGTPYAYYEALRDKAMQTPVGWSEQLGGFWVVAGYDACNEIIHNQVAFSNAAVTFPMYATGEKSPLKIVGQDEPGHKRDRAFLASPFSPRQVAKYEPAIRTITEKLVDRFIEDGEADVGQLLGEELPARLTALLLGLPEDQGDLYRGWLWAMTHLHIDQPHEAARITGEMHEYFATVLEERKRDPGDDLLSLVTHAELNGERLTDEDLLGICIVILVGGIDNSARILNTALRRLGWDLESRRRLIARPTLMSTFVDEVLRYYSPPFPARVLVKQDVAVGGVVMREGDVAVLAIPVANRDGRQFPNPDSFIPDRTPNRHLTFGVGIHRCLGIHLLRVEACAALDQFLARVPDYRLHPTKTARWINGQSQGMRDVPIVFPPGHAVSA